VVKKFQWRHQVVPSKNRQVPHLTFGLATLVFSNAQYASCRPPRRDQPSKKRKSA
jgi:hypothetical protein